MPSTTLLNILYVEDDLDIQVVAQIALEVVGGFKLRTCSSGMDALKAVQDGYVPDLLLLDVMMPNMDGPTTLQELRKLETTAKTPVIFMTAKVQSSEKEYYLSLGATDVIAKPFDPMSLASQVKQLWDASSH
jgi:two-component system OmpR family response regulator